MDLLSAILLLATDPADPGPRPMSPLENPLVILVLMGVFIYFFLIRPQKKEQEQKQKMLAGLKKNDRVVTTGGIYGTVVNVKDNEVTLRVDDQAKVKIRFRKAAVSAVVTETGATDGAQKG